VAAGSGDGSQTAVPDEEPRVVDTSVAHPARIWDYWLDGKDNYAADRAAAEHVFEATPVVKDIARADRAFLASVVRHLTADLGIRQFLDIGTGLPTANNTHEVAQRAAPESRIVYVDNDPTVLVHARALLTSDPRGATAYIDADARDTGTILATAAGTLDFRQPVAVMLLGILLFIPDEDDPWAITARLMDAVPPGSYLAISHGASDIQAQDMTTLNSRYNDHSAVAMRLRPKDELARFFDGLDLVGPGVVPINHWQPGPASDTRRKPVLPAYAALGRKPAGLVARSARAEPGSSR
jgi:S-adenosyl methyltransferase